MKSQSTAVKAPASKSHRTILAAVLVIFGSMGAQANLESYESSFETTNKFWTEVFALQGKKYKAPNLVVYLQPVVATACGAGRLQAGPFYCPNDQTVYINPGFNSYFQSRFSASPLSEPLIVSHEVAHHVQALTGLLRLKQGMAEMAGQENYFSVAVELQADCLAGVVIRRSQVVISPNFLTRVFGSASNLGDDRLAGHQVLPAMLTHGTSAQREAFVMRGFDLGLTSACNGSLLM